MDYERALQEWGAQKLEKGRQIVIDRSSVKVDMDFDPGFACCNGADEDCYCSLATPPSASVAITGLDTKGRSCRSEIDSYEFNFHRIVREVVLAGGGTVTA